MAKLKTFAYMCIGFAMSLITSKMMNVEQSTIAIISLPFIGLLHEMLHFMVINAVKAQYKFVMKGLYIGFNVSVERIEDFIAIALAPQAISLFLAILYMFTYSSVLLALMLIHIAISLEDLHKSIKYARQVLY
ncbi:MAG: metalloprotease family protein [Ignisphaera sp.]